MRHRSRLHHLPPRDAAILAAMPTADEAQRLLAKADEAEARLDCDALVAYLSAAVRELTAASQPRRAAMACVRLGQTYENALGNLTAARAWFARAARVIETEPACVEQGWVAIDRSRATAARRSASWLAVTSGCKAAPEEAAPWPHFTTTGGSLISSRLRPPG